MTKRHALIILGVVIALMPFTGVPDSWRKAVIVVAGLAVIVLSYVRNVSMNAPAEVPPQA